MIEIDKVLNTILSESTELPQVLVQGLTNNSSKVKKGFIFFAFKGENNDGNDFIEDAFKNEFGTSFENIKKMIRKHKKEIK